MLVTYGITIGIGMIVFYLSSTPFIRTSKANLTGAIDAYRYLLGCNGHSHTKTISKMCRGVADYYNHRHLTCSIQKTKRHTYEIDYRIGGQHHRIQVTIYKGPHALHKKPHAVSIH